MISLSKLEVSVGRCRRHFLSIKSLCFVIFALFVMNSSYSQAESRVSTNYTKLSNAIQLAYNNVELKTVLDDLQQESNRNIIYSPEDVSPYQNVSVHCNSADLNVVMDEVLKSTNLDYELKAQQVLIFNESSKSKVTVTNAVRAQQEEVTVKGQVIDDSGAPIPGVTVLLVGTTKGIITDFDGNYTIKVPANGSLSFSYVGYKPQTIAVGGKTTLNVTLVEDRTDLDEVVIVAYGIQKKSDLTGAVSSVKSEDMQKVAVATPAESLQGRVSGVSVSASSGAPGAGISVRVRGVASFGGNTPLYIIDGVEGDINNINPDDISSMEVLKDASSAAIYGSRAANGVVIVTTKKGKEGKVKVSFSAYAGPQTVAKTLPLMTSSADWLKVNRAAYENTIANETAAGVDPSKMTQLGQWHNDDASKFANTDWQDAMYRTGLMQNYNLNFTGGTEDISFLFSAGYFDQEGVVIGTDYNKLSTRLKLDMKIGKLTISPNISIAQSNSNEFTTSIFRINRITPFVPVYDETKKNGYGYSDYTSAAENNPVGEQNLNEHKTKNTDINTNLMASMEVIDGLYVKLNTGYRNNFYNYRKHHPSYQVNPKDLVEFPKNEEGTTHYSQYLIEPTVSYHFELDKHGFDVLGGGSIQSQYARNHGVSAEGKDAKGNPAGFPDENFNTINAGQGGTFSGWGTEYTFNRASVFGRINYSYDSKYLFQATVRRDGTSKFSEDYRYGVFPSFSAGWNVHRENFWEPLADVVSRLKVRASWGKLGSDDNLKNYFYQGLMKAGYSYVWGGTLTGGAYPSGMYIDDYRWEESVDTNLGFDFGLLEDMVYGSVNYFISTRKDILVKQPLPASSGMTSQMMNIGEMKNSGWEFEVGIRDKKGDFTWDAAATLSTIKNEVIRLGDGIDIQKGSNVDYKIPAVWTVVGESVGSFYTYKTDGIFQNESEIIGSAQEGVAKPGDIRFVDVNGDKKIDSNDITSTGSALPDFEYSLNVNMAYKGFDMSIFFNGKHGNKIFNLPRYYGESMVGNFNYWDTTLDYWTPTNTDTNIPRPVQDDTNNSRISDRYIENGSYLRLKSLQIGYTFPKSMLESVNIEKLRVYVSGQNLFTITDYTGYDPEISGFAKSDSDPYERRTLWNMGVDYGVYPTSRTFLFGVQLNF